MDDIATRRAIRVSGIDSALAERIRTTLRDDFGNELHVQITQDVRSNPCRHCLRLTNPGERLILFAHRPFTTTGPYAETGPIFIHADACEAYGETSVFPADFQDRPWTVRAYDGAGNIVTGVVAQAGGAQAAIERQFEDPAVTFIHLRSPSWGCYDFQVERA